MVSEPTIPPPHRKSTQKKSPNFFLTAAASTYGPSSATSSPSPPSEASSSRISMHQVVTARALHAGATLPPATPTRCSTRGSAVNIGNNHAVVTFPTSGMMLLPPMTSTGAGNGTLQGVHGLGVNTPASCSTNVLTSPREGSTAGAITFNTSLGSTSFPCFDGTNPHLRRIDRKSVV